MTVQLIVAALLVVGVVLLWMTNLLGLPGNWLIVLLAAPYAYFTEPATKMDVGWKILVAMIVLAAIGELIEFLASALGASKVGGSKRAAALAMLGSVAGALLGTAVGTGVLPVIGSVIGALCGASLGALGGGYLGERWKGRDVDSSLRVGHAAFWGRLFGTVGKIVVGIGMIAVLTAALVV